MLKMTITAKGPPECLRPKEVGEPTPGDGEVRIRMRAVGVAWADTMARRGQYPSAPKIPFAPGYDIVGVIDGLGEGCDPNLKIGQRVGALLLKFGGCAELVCVDQRYVVHVPDGLTDSDAVSVILNGLTAYDVLHRVAGAEAGKSILITSAAGGVGSYLVQLAHQAGMLVLGTTSTSKLARVERLGAVAIDRLQEDVPARAKEHCDGGVDVVIDLVGDASTAMACLRPGGKLVSLGGLAFKDHGLFGLVMAITRQSLTVLSTWGKSATFYGDLPHNVRKNPDWYRSTLTELFGMLERGDLESAVALKLPLIDAAKAHTLLEGGTVGGKIVLISESC